ncbi:type VII secretion protein EccB [Rhizomonospora bruguierae]|uniref:type VII secretion protein EccB n=1 Tax=Rhizomonospora bruguierae TaxID=1581705 RepID=UPI001BCA7D87|nr:type VII secretion protein EccB [Micromonospora sp. NBRC 107566]
MPTRQELLHSYQFTIQRVVAALTQRDTDPARSPLRRAAGTTLAGVLVAAIAVGAVAAYGLLTGAGSTGWRDGSAIIVERESGARYVYREGALHPVLNHASALLILGTAQPRTVLTGRRTLSAAPRGAPLGIPGAPDPMPLGGQIVGTPWTVCALPTTPPSSVLLIGREPPGAPLADRGLLVREPGGARYLVLRGRRHTVAQESVLAALGWAGRDALPVPAAFVNALPMGAPLDFPPIPGRGERSPNVPGAMVGEVFVVVTQGGARQYAVVTRAGLADATPVQADLVLTDPETRRAVGQSAPTRLTPGEFTALARTSKLDSGDIPASAPPLAEAQGPTCAAVRDEATVPAVRTGAALPDLTAVPRTAAATEDGTLLADRVLVPPGHGALVEAAPAPGAPGALSVVTDLGRRHALASRALLATLGYADVHPLRMPTSLVSLVPAGPALDPAAAGATAD